MNVAAAPERRMTTEIGVFLDQGCGRCDRFGTPDCATQIWREGIAALRRVCLEAGLTETVKWGHACYMHAGRNVALIAAVRGDFRLNFIHAALLTDPEGIMERQGAATKVPDCVRFDGAPSVAAKAAAVLALLRQAMAFAERGVRPERVADEREWPEELVEALDADPALAEAFQALTPGRQRSYVIALAGAKKAETRVARIAAFRGRILAGKGAQER